MLPTRPLANSRSASRRVVVALTLGTLAIAVPTPGRAAASTSDVQATKPDVWRGKSVALTSRAPGSFGVATRSGQLSAAIAFATLHHVQSAELTGAGKTIAAKNGLEDGAGYVGQKLRADAVARYGAVESALPPIATTETYSVKIARAAEGSDLVIDVRPLGAALRERVTGAAGQYAVGFSTSVWVIDARAHTRIAQANCGGGGKWHSMDELLADNAALLKSELHALWDECAVALETKMLNFAPVTDTTPPAAPDRDVLKREPP
jgi:hypothetical protein